MESIYRIFGNSSENSNVEGGLRTAETKDIHEL